MDPIVQDEINRINAEPTYGPIEKDVYMEVRYSLEDCDIKFDKFMADQEYKVRQYEKYWSTRLD